MALSRFADVNVTQQVTVQAVASFSDSLYLAQVPESAQAARFLSYESADEMTLAGLPTAVIAAGAIFFAQNPNPGALIVGRQVPGTAKVVTVTITTTANGTWDFAFGADTVTYAAAGAPTEQVIAEGLYAQAALYAAKYNTTLSTPIGGVFTITANVAGDDFTIGALTVPGAGAGSTATTTPTVAPEDASDALDAIVAAGGVFYGIATQSRSEAVIDDIAGWAIARSVMFFAQTADPDVVAATVGNMASDLFLLGNEKTDITWHADSTEFADVATMSRVLARDLDSRNSTTAFFSLTGVTPDAGRGVVNPLTSAEIANIELHSNSITLEGGVSVRFPGKVTSGDFTDIVITMAWLKARLKEAIFGAYVGAPDGLTYDLEGVAVLESTIRGVCQNAVDARHIKPGFVITLPDPAALTAAVRASRNLPNGRVTANFRGFIHTIDLDVFLQF